MKTTTKKQKRQLGQKGITLKELLAGFCADIDVFLLKDESQENDLDKMYSKEEIRQQLKKTLLKFGSFSFVHPSVYDIPLFPTLTNAFLLDMGFSKAELESIEKTLDNN
jgi:hypothetical protein